MINFCYIMSVATVVVMFIATKPQEANSYILLAISQMWTMTGIIVEAIKQTITIKGYDRVD